MPYTQRRASSDSERQLAKLRADASSARAAGSRAHMPGVPARPLPYPASAPSTDASSPTTWAASPRPESGSTADARAPVEERDGGVRLAGGPLFEDGDVGPEVELLPPSYAQLHPGSR